MNCASLQVRNASLALLTMNEFANLFAFTIHKSLTQGSQVLLRCSLQMVYQSTEELSIRTNGTNRKTFLRNGDNLSILALVRVS